MINITNANEKDYEKIVKQIVFYLEPILHTEESYTGSALKCAKAIMNIITRKDK